MGEVKYILIHHEKCPREAFHYRIQSDGTQVALLPEQHRGQHPYSIGIVLDGNFDQEKVPTGILESLKNLVLKLKLKYPDAKIGAHRQIRGDKNTSCPGRLFPLRDVLTWSRTGLLKERDEFIVQDIESQYGP